MTRRAVNLSSWFVDPDRDPIRNPPRPLSLRHDDYEDGFDFTTVFYDAFWDTAGSSVILIGPPLLNLEADLDLTVIACPSMVRCSLVLRHVFLGCQAVAQPPAGTTGLILRTGQSESFIAPQPNLCGLFRGRRTAVTLSRNNELAWMRDWVAFNRHYHGCDGVLIYDNNSTSYSANDIYDCIESVAGGMQVVVLSWPYKYGVPDWRLPLSYGVVDSLYCQTGMLEHARRRFLAQAASVLNSDVDELVLTEGGSSVLELVEKSTTGLLAFGGLWVENHPLRRGGDSGRPPRHRDFAYVGTDGRVGCESKWAVVPSRVPDAAQWHVHRVLGMVPSESRQIVEMRHFKAINTDWTLDRSRSQDRRTASGAIDPQHLRLDVRLQEALAKVFPEESNGLSVVGDTRPARCPYGWRVRAGRLAAERRWPEAIDAMQAALSLMPDHPGLLLFSARLQEQARNHGAARALRAEAEALRRLDARYHLQCGRWLQDEGKLVAARECFADAIERDPRFAAAYHELARQHDDHGDPPGEAEAILETCSRRVPDDALTRALLAKALERRGRVHDALVHTEAAIELDPENPHYHCLHARVLRRTGRLEAALQVARRGMALDDLPARMQAFGRRSTAMAWQEYQWCAPIAPALHAELGEILVATGDLAAAEAAARSALSLARMEPDRYYRLSEILTMRGCRKEAAGEREAAIALARQEMRRPTPREWPLVNRNRNWESRANRLSRILSAAGHRDEAITVLREALVTVPDSTAIKDNLAASLVDGGDREAAAALLRSAIQKRPKDARLRHRLSKVIEATHPRQAISSAKAAAALEPDNPSFQDHLVALLLAAERDDEAALALAKALPLNGQHAPLHHGLSRLLQRAGRSEEAVAAARRTVELDPLRPRWREHLAALLMDAGKDDEAEAALREAVQRNVESGGLYLRLSRLLQQGRRGREALAAARRAVGLEPQKPYLREHLVALLMEAGEDAEAETALREALELHPRDAALHFHLSRLAQQRQRPEEALAAARRAVELDRARPRWRDHLAALLVDFGRLDEAEAVLRRAVRRRVESGGLYLRLSRLLQRQRRPDEARAMARRAVALEPQKPYLHEHLVALLMEGGDEDEAATALRHALGLHPRDAALHFHLSRLSQQRQRAEEALAAARRAVELDPRRPRWRHHLAALRAEAAELEASGPLSGRSGGCERLAVPI